MDERLKEYSPNDNQIREGKLILIRDYDIQRALYLILNFKTDMAKMVNKYSVFYYGDQRGVRKDAFWIQGKRHIERKNMIIYD